MPGAAIPTKRANPADRSWSRANGALSVIGAPGVLRPPHCERLGVPPTPQIGRYRTAQCEHAACPAISMMHCTKTSRARQVDRRALWNRIYWPGTTVKVADTVWSAKLGVITKTKIKTKGETPCLFKSTKTLQQ